MMNTKVILISIGTTALVLVGAIVFFSRNQTPDVPKEEIVATNGLHWHPKLTITINGKNQKIPANVGILPAKHEEIHTHEDAEAGILHMEMTGEVTKDETRLGRFFEIWGKKFSSSQIFDFKNSTEAAVKMFVNNKENKEFENYLMRDGDKIEIRYE